MGIVSIISRTGTASATATPAAPNVISASSVTVSFSPDGHDQNTLLSGTFTLNASDPNYAQDQTINLYTSLSGVLTLLTSITGNPISTPQTYTNQYLGPQSIVGGQTLKIVFVCLNSKGTPSATPFSTAAFTIPTALSGILSISAAEVGPVYTTSVGGNVESLHTIISVTPVLSAYPAYVTVWINQNLTDSYGNLVGPTNQGSFLFTSAAPSIQLGGAGGSVPGGIYTPTNPSAGTWEVAGYPGDVSGNTIPTGAITATFSVAVAQACLPTDLSGAVFLPDPVTGSLIDYYLESSGAVVWLWHEIDFTAPTVTSDPYFWIALLTVQKGFLTTGTCTVSSSTTLVNSAAPFTSAMVGLVVHVNGVWNTIASCINSSTVTLSNTATNGSGLTFDMWTPSPDYEGTNDDADLLYYGREVTETGDGSLATTAGNLIQIVAGNIATTGWTFPIVNLPSSGLPNPYRTFKFELYAVSRLGQNPTNGSGGTYTRQTCWAGGADAFYLTPAPQPPTLDFTQGNPATLGQGLTVDVNGKPIVNVGSGLTLSSGAVIPNLGAGMTLSGNTIVPSLGPGQVLNTSNQITPSLGPGQTLNGSGQIVPSLGPGSTLNGSNEIIPNLGPGSALNGSNQIVPNLGPGQTLNGSSQIVPNLGYTMGLNSSNQVVLDNLQVVSGLPTLPNALYPAGSVVVNSVDSMVYRTSSGLIGTWVQSTNPADLIAGAVAFGVTLTASAVVAGTFTGFTFNGCTLSLNDNGITTSIQNQTNSIFSFVGLKCLNNSTNTYSAVSSSSLGCADPGNTQQVVAQVGSGLASFAVGGPAGNTSITSSTTSSASNFTLLFDGFGSYYVNMNNTDLTVQMGFGSQFIVFQAQASGTTVSLSGLPSSNPGSGSKQLWYNSSTLQVFYQP